MRATVFLLVLAVQPSHASAAELMVTAGPTVVCVDPDALRAVLNMTDPRRSNPAWFYETNRSGGCSTIAAGTTMRIQAIAGDLARVQLPYQPELVFVRLADLSLAS